MVTTPAVEGCSGSNEIRLGNRARREGRKIKTHDLLQIVRSMHRGGNSVLCDSGIGGPIIYPVQMNAVRGAKHYSRA